MTASCRFFRGIIMLEIMFEMIFNRIIKKNQPWIEEIPEGKKRLLKKFNNSIKSNPDKPNGYFDRGNLNFKLERYQDAIKDYNRAIRLDPKHLQAYHSRAIAKDKLSYYNGAIADYNLILKIDPSDLLANKNKRIIQQRFIA